MYKFTRYRYGTCVYKCVYRIPTVQYMFRI